MEHSHIYDISPLISEDIAVWPGDKPFKRKVNLSMVAGDNIELSEISATLHLGAHADAPSHYTATGRSIDQLEIEPYLGLCQVVTVSEQILIRPEHFHDKIAASTTRVLFKTSSYPDPNKFNEDFAALSSESIDFLARRGVVLVGIDTPSVDPFHSKELPAHNSIASHDMRNLEGLILSHVPDGIYELIALPLLLAKCDASPVRAILRRQN